MYGSDGRLDGSLLKRQNILVNAVMKSRRDRSEASYEKSDLGWSFVHQKRYDTAMAAFNDAWLLDSENGEAHYGFATVVMRRDHDARSAERSFKMAVEKPKVPPNAFVEYGQLLLSLGRVDDSLEILYKALDRSPKISNARSYIAGAYYQKKNFAKACQWAQSAVENKDVLKRRLLEESCSRE